MGIFSSKPEQTPEQKHNNLGGQSTNIIEAILYRMQKEKLEQQGGKNKSKKTTKPKTKSIKNVVNDSIYIADVNHIILHI